VVGSGTEPIPALKGPKHVDAGAGCYYSIKVVISTCECFVQTTAGKGAIHRKKVGISKEWILVATHNAYRQNPCSIDNLLWHVAAKIA
jgi:hypothetical protein